MSPSTQRSSSPDFASEPESQSTSQTATWEAIVAQQQNQLNQLMISHQQLLQQQMAAATNPPQPPQEASNFSSNDLRELQRSVDNLTRGQAQQQQTLNSLSSTLSSLVSGRNARRQAAAFFGKGWCV